MSSPGVVRLPRHAPGMRIGLYGGTFNPAHAGHRHVSLLALKRLELDRLWWVVTPGNPLKERGGLAPACERAEAARAMARHPRIDVTCFEEEIGAQFTVDTLEYVAARCPTVRFVWIMGADSLGSFHRWRGWRRIARLMPVAVIDRPGWTLRAAHAQAAQALGPYRIDESDAPLLPDMAPPAWAFLHGPRSSLSSSELRNKGEPLPCPAVEIGAGAIETQPPATLC